MDEITARIMVAVETGNAIRNIDNLRAQIDKLTAAGQRNIKISMPNVKIVQPRPYPQGVINRPKDSGDGSGPTRLNKEAIKEEIAASTRALQKQREELSAVNAIISQRGKVSLDALKIEQAAARKVTAEYRQQRAELALLRAEQKFNSANQNLFSAKLNKDDPRRILALSNAAEEYKRRWTAAQQVAADAAISARKAEEEYQSLVKPLEQSGDAAENSSKKIEKLSAKTLAMRVTARRLGVDIGDGVNPNMLRLGAYAAVAGMALKVARVYVDQFYESLKYGSEIAKLNREENKFVTDRLLEQVSKERSAIDSIDELQKKERLSNVEKLKMSNLLKELSSDYKNLGLEIDAATGKISGWDEASSKARKKLLKERAAALQQNIRDIDSQVSNNRNFVNDSSNYFWDIVTLGRSVSEREQFEKENLSLFNERAKVLNELQRVQKQLATFDQDSAAAMEAQKKDLDDQINRQRSLYRIQEMRAMGMEREARYAEIVANWEGRRLQYGGAVDEFINAEKRLYDLSAKRERENVMGDLVSSRFRLRETAQSATFANSLEAARLQSRIILGNSSGLSRDTEQKKIEQNTKNTAQGLSDLKEVMQRILATVENFQSVTV